MRRGHGDLAEPQNNDKWLQFKYDYMGRRVEKTYSVRSGSSWVVQSGYPQRFVYDGWNVVLVLDGNNVAQRKYTWGLDLSGTIHGAGGIGCLLACVETQGTTTTTDDKRYWFFYDANGNVGQILDATNINNISIAATYEYDPYGNVIGPDLDGDGDWQDDATPYALANPIRFSTKWFDTDFETGLGCWPKRYYSPRLGRWISRDPIEDLSVRRWGTLAHVFMQGRAALRRHRKDNIVYRTILSDTDLVYQYVFNRPCDGIDPLGLDGDFGPGTTSYDCPETADDPNCDGCCDPPSIDSMISLGFGVDHTVMCDGEGNCRAVLRDNDFPEDVRNCIIEHECTHCKQMKLQGDPCCHCVLPSPPPFANAGQADESECEACIGSAKCLQRALDECRGDCHHHTCELCKHICMAEYHCDPVGGLRGGPGARILMELCLEKCRETHACWE